METFCADLHLEPGSPSRCTITSSLYANTILAGSALIQACEKAGKTIPRYCYHEKRKIIIKNSTLPMANFYSGS